MIKNEEKLCKEYGSFQDMSRFCRRSLTDSLEQCIFGTQMLWSQSVSHRYSYTRRSMQMKEWMVETVPEIGRFHTSNGLFESFKMSYRMQETTIRIADKAGIVPIMMVKVWIERLPEFMKGYLSGDIRNMDDLGLFFKTLLQKDLVEKGKKRLRWTTRRWRRWTYTQVQLAQGIFKKKLGKRCVFQNWRQLEKRKIQFI